MLDIIVLLLGGDFMEDIFEVIKKRRSVRSYKPDYVEREKIEKILDAAIWAPSSHNSQPWHFTVIKNDGLGKELNEATKLILLKSDSELLQKLGKRPDLFYGAPIVVVVSGLSKLSTSIIDCSAATENMLLAAEYLGLGTCWNGLVTNLFLKDPGHEVIKKLQIPEDYSPLYAVAVGYPVHLSEAPSRKGNPIQFLEY